MIAATAPAFTRAGRFSLFGASQGGQIAAAVAARYPDQVDALVLSGMEFEVAALAAEGLTNASMATRLPVAPRTAETHIENIRRKLHVRPRAQIAAWVTEHRPSR